MTVQVSDGNGGTDTQAIAVTVTNVNEAPHHLERRRRHCDGHDCGEHDGGNDGGRHRPRCRADAELCDRWWRGSGKFSINPNTGVLAFSTAPDFEAPTDLGANNVYDVTVQSQTATVGSTLKP